MAAAHDASLTFSACFDGPVDPLAGLPLCELFACPFSGRLFAPWEAQIRIEPQPSPPAAARTFFCPVCPSAALRIHALGAQEAASCTLCGWVASRASVRAATDLLSREADPWPEVSGVVVARATNATSNAHTHGAKMPRAPPPRRTVAECVEEERTRESAMRGMHVQDAADLMPEDGDAERRQGSLRVSKILPLSFNILAKDVWLRESVPPARRLRSSCTVLASPHSGRDIHDAVLPSDVTDEKRPRNAARFMPRVIYSRVWHDCLSDDDTMQKVKVTLALRNVCAANMHIALIDVNANDDPSTVDGANASIAPGDESILEMRTTALRVPHGAPKACPQVVTMRMRVWFDALDAGVDCDAQDTDKEAKPFWKHEWRCTAFVTHERNVLRKGAE